MLTSVVEHRGKVKDKERLESGQQRPHRTPGAKVRIVVFISSNEKPLEDVVQGRDRSMFASLQHRSPRSEEGRLLGARDALGKGAGSLLQETQRR